MFVRRITLGLLIAAGLLAAADFQMAVADEPPAAGDAKLEKKSDEKSADLQEPAADDAKIDQFAVPEGGVPELLTFVLETLKFRPKTSDEALAFRLRGMAAIKEAIEKIQKTATEADKKLPGYEQIDGLVLYFRAQDRDATAEARKKLVEDLKAYYASTPDPSTYALNAGRILASSLEYGGEPAEAITVYRELGGVLVKSNDETIARTGAVMEGAARRLGLIGQPLEIAGTEMDGTKFDWNKLRGKVVLVDFWATWCGPCLGELPNVRENYRLYHDKGFEVVGISLDRDRQALEKFLADEQNPWITLHDGDWKENAVATYYGVMGIPTVILVDQQGKVVSTQARGPELGKLLENLLGPPEPAADLPENPEQAKEAGAAKTE